MTKIIAVRFRTAGKVYYFSPGEYEIKRGTHVIVTTSRGTEYGTVVAPPTMVEDTQVTQPLKEIVRLATREDEERAQSNREKEKEAYRICAQKIRERELEMKLIDAEYTFDNAKVLFYFTADERVDFRELVKDLAGVFRTRIELRQIGVRDETKIIGGIGTCGRPLCCHAYLRDFQPVSIKMAKEQSLSLNPTKISGVCGRLMCCLKNEEEVYEEVNKRLPKLGDIVEIPDKSEAEVVGTNVLRETVRVLIDNGEEKQFETYPLDQVTFLRKKQKRNNQQGKTKEADAAREEDRAQERKGNHKQAASTENSPNGANKTATEKTGGSERNGRFEKSQNDRPRNDKNKANKNRNEKNKSDKPAGEKNKHHSGNHGFRKNDGTHAPKNKEGSRQGKSGWQPRNRHHKQPSVTEKGTTNT